jgi:hypothetical protein
LRQAAAPLALARSRLANRSVSTLLVATGVAIGAGVVAAVLGGTLVSEHEHLARAVEEIPAAERSVQVAHFGVLTPGERYDDVDRRVQTELAGLGLADPVRVVQYKLLRIAGHRTVLAGIEDVGRWVRLESGRLPRTCSPERCEVVVVGSGAIRGDTDVPLVEVGRGTLASPLPFGRLGTTGSETSEALGERAPAPLAIAAGVRAVSELPALAAIYRSYAWVAPLPQDRVRPWTVDAFAADVERARSSLHAVTSSFDVSAPVAPLRARAATGRVAAHRLLLVGGQAAALLFAFALFAAATMRRDVDASWQRLTWFGARRWQLVALTAAEAAVVVAAAVAVGWLAGSGVTALVAERAGAPTGGILRHSVASATGFALAAGLAALATALIFGALRARDVPVGGRTLSALDVAALGAALAVVLIVAGGDADAAAVDRGGTAAALLLLPGLVLFTAAVLTARILGPALRGLERITRRATPCVRLAALSVARRPGYAVAATAFLVVSLSLAFFAVVYRATLVEGREEQVRYAYPADFLVREDLSPNRLVRPLAAAPLQQYRALPGSERALPVLRRRGSVSGIARSQELVVLGLPAEEIGTIDGWRSDFSQETLDELARLLRPAGDVSLRGEPIPDDAVALTVPASVLGDDVVVIASIRARDDRFTELELGRTRGNRPVTLRAALPEDARGGLLLGLALRRTLGVEEHAQGNVPTLRGVLELGDLAAERAGGAATVVSGYDGWLGSGGVEGLPGTNVTHLNFFVGSAAEAKFRARQPVDENPVAVVASPGVADAAASDGTLPVRLATGQVNLRVAATASRWPTLSGEFVVVDEAALATAMNTVKPGSASVDEVWVDAASRDQVAQALSSPPFDVLEVADRASFEDELHTQPLARGTLAIVTASAVVAVLLALLGLGLLLAGDLRDEDGELFDLEAQGAAPPALRRHVALRVAAVAVPAVLGAMAASTVLAALVVDFVTVTAAAETPEPPLQLSADWLILVGLAAGYLLLAAGTTAAVVRLAFRAPTPRSASA